jgi:hypothetical protein
LQSVSGTCYCGKLLQMQELPETLGAWERE